MVEIHKNRLGDEKEEELPWSIEGGTSRRWEKECK
jgi:hypothetical protein